MLPTLKTVHAFEWQSVWRHQWGDVGCILYTGGHFKWNSSPEIAGLTSLSLLLIRSIGGALRGVERVFWLSIGIPSTRTDWVSLKASLISLRPFLESDPHLMFKPKIKFCCVVWTERTQSNLNTQTWYILIFFFYIQRDLHFPSILLSLLSIT